jgi:DNA-binding CsgD family transcriptional regulator
MKKTFISKFCYQIADLFPYVGTDEFMMRLADFFKKITYTDTITMVLFPSKKLPIIQYNDTLAGIEGSIIDQYVKGAFLLDPFYLVARKNSDSSFVHIRDTDADVFEESEYYKSHYKYSYLKDECGYVIQLSENSEQFLLIGLGQINTEQPFSADILKELSEIMPMIELIVKSHWQGILEQQSQNDQQEQLESSLDLREQLETALNCFGTSILTVRENQTIKMILQGHSSKAIAQRFNISVETIKLHRKNAYAKLDLGTQGELFNLFINSLMNIENYAGGDPLIQYHTIC